MPHERAWLDRIYEELQWVDIFREITDEPDLYTWWSNRGQAWANNVGWRLDYMLVTPGLSGTGRRQSIYRDERFSDHAPLTIDFAIPKPK
jgi:exodeoxyribonuclease-3